MRDVEFRIAVDHIDAGGQQLCAGRLVFDLAAAPRGVEHHPHLDAAPLRIDHCRQQRRIREQEDLDAQRLFRRSDGIDEGLDGVIRQNYERAMHERWAPRVVCWQVANSCGAELREKHESVFD